MRIAPISDGGSGCTPDVDIINRWRVWKVYTVEFSFYDRRLGARDLYAIKILLSSGIIIIPPPEGALSPEAQSAISKIERASRMLFVRIRNFRIEQCITPPFEIDIEHLVRNTGVLFLLAPFLSYIFIHLPLLLLLFFLCSRILVRRAPIAYESY